MVALEMSVGFETRGIPVLLDSQFVQKFKTKRPIQLCDAGLKLRFGYENLMGFKLDC